MSEFNESWISIQEVYSEQNEKEIYNHITNARKIIFVARGRVGLVTKMFMQRLIQLGHDCFWYDDLNIPMINGEDLVIFVSASGHTISSHIYISIAKEVGARTLAITFNDTGRITLADQTAVIYQDKKAYLASELFEQMAPRRIALKRILRKKHMFKFRDFGAPPPQIKDFHSFPKGFGLEL